MFFLGYPDAFDSDLKKLFENFASQEKENIDYKLFSREIKTPSKNTFSFLQKHGNFYYFLTNVLENTSLNRVRSLQVKFLDDLMNGFNVYKKIKGVNKVEDHYLYLLGNPRRTVYELFLNTPKDKYNKEIYLQAQKLFSLRENIFKKLTNKGIINNDFDQSSIVEQKYKKEYKESIAKKTKLEPEFMESIAERNILRKQRLNEIAKKEKTIDNNFFKKYFEYSIPSNMYKSLNTNTDIEENKTKVNKMKNNLADLVMKIKNNPTNNTKKN